MARPKKEELKTRRITIRVTELEYQTFMELAKKQKMTLAEYVRQQAIHGKIETHYDIKAGEDELKELCREFHKIGINLNQISRFLNTGGTVGKDMIREIRNLVSELFTLRQELIEYMEGNTRGNPEASRK